MHRRRRRKRGREGGEYPIVFICMYLLWNALKTTILSMIKITFFSIGAICSGMFISDLFS